MIKESMQKIQQKLVDIGVAKWIKDYKGRHYFKCPNVLIMQGQEKIILQPHFYTNCEEKKEDNQILANNMIKFLEENFSQWGNVSISKTNLSKIQH